jgi:glutathione synthase
MKTKILAIQGDGLNNLNPKTDTTILLALEAQRRNYQIYYYRTKNLTYIKNKVTAKCDEISFIENSKKFYKIKRKINLDLSKAKVILMRQDPPFNMDYITAAYLLEKLPKKVKVINNPKSVRDISEKLYSTNFIKFMPPTIFTQDIEIIFGFFKRFKKIVIKPIHGYGGNDILLIKNYFNKKIIQNFIKKNRHIMIQKFLPEIKNGDRRVFIIGGKIKGAISRIPKKGSILSNMSKGAKAKIVKLNKKETNISNLVSKKLIKNKIVLAGVDFIGSKLNGDLNVTSPTGLKTYKDLSGIDLSKDFWNYVENKYAVN